MHLPKIRTPVSLIVHSRHEVNTAFCNGRYFFVEVRRDGIVLYELDDEKLAEPRPRASADALRLAEDFLHQAVEQAYSALLLAQTSYSPHLII